MAYLQFEAGAQLDAAGRALSDTSWSSQLLQSERLWMWLEGTHVLTLMLFAGTILFVDLRLLGAALPNVPVTRITRALLPYTVAGFIIIVATGLLLFLAKPFDYWHNFAFRLKALLLVAAGINVWVFHWRSQADQAAWDEAARPPAKARLAAAFSILVWIVVIAAGRSMAYEWFGCDNASGFIAAAAQCEAKAETLAQLKSEIAQ